MDQAPRPRVSRRVRTDPAAGDPRLRGRTYAIAFERVWTAALALAGGGLARWTVLRADDGDGVIEAKARSLLRRWRDVRIDVGLDENGQTRVDLVAATREGRPDLGGNARLVGRFLAALDRALDVSPSQVLDASRQPSFTA